MSETRLALSKEQAGLLALAVESGRVLMTPPGSDNDIRWGELSDLGLMEPADAPPGLSVFHCWRLTNEGRAALTEGERT